MVVLRSLPFGVVELLGKNYSIKARIKIKIMCENSDNGEDRVCRCCRRERKLYKAFGGDVATVKVCASKYEKLRTGRDKL